MAYRLYVDDIRTPESQSEWIIARSSAEAIDIVVMEGIPECMSLDHDLGGEDTAMVFLKALTALYPDGPVPDTLVHSQNPIGRENIISYINSWDRSLKI